MAFEELYARHRGALYRYINHQGHDDRSLQQDLDKLSRAYQKTDSSEAQPTPAHPATAASVSGELQLAQKSDAVVRIESILARKQAGDQSWLAALRDFIKAYPDYPLPDQLKP